MLAPKPPPLPPPLAALFLLPLPPGRYSWCWGSGRVGLLSRERSNTHVLRSLDVIEPVGSPFRRQCPLHRRLRMAYHIAQGQTPTARSIGMAHYGNEFACIRNPSTGCNRPEPRLASVPPFPRRVETELMCFRCRPTRCSGRRCCSMDIPDTSRGSRVMFDPRSTPMLTKYPEDAKVSTGTTTKILGTTKIHPCDANSNKAPCDCCLFSFFGVVAPSRLCGVCNRSNLPLDYS